MDPMSIAAAVIGLVTSTETLARAVSALGGIDQPAKIASEIRFYTLLLGELGDIILKNQNVSPSTSAAAMLCHDRLHDLEDLISSRRPKAEDIRIALSSFHSSIMLLRDMVMDSVTHTLLQEQREAQVQALESDLKQRARNEGAYVVNIDADAGIDDLSMEKIKQLLSIHNNPKADNQVSAVINVGGASGRHSDPSERKADIDQLRSKLQKLNLQVQAGKNPFQRVVHVLHADQERGHLKFVAKIDTASRKNWVTSWIVQQLNLQDRIQQVQSPMGERFTGAGGDVFQANGHVTLTWYDSVVARTRENEFLVNDAEGAPFDLIFGWEWLVADGESAFAEPFLAIMKEVNLTEGEAQNREMQANLFSQTSENSRLAPVRRAEASNKREAKRLQKAANASLAASPARTPAFSSRHTPRRSTSPEAGIGALEPEQPASRDDSSDQRQQSQG